MQFQCSLFQVNTYIYIFSLKNLCSHEVALCENCCMCMSNKNQRNNKTIRSFFYYRENFWPFIKKQLDDDSNFFFKCQNDVTFIKGPWKSYFLLIIINKKKNNFNNTFSLKLNLEMKRINVYLIIIICLQVLFNFVKLFFKQKVTSIF